MYDYEEKLNKYLTKEMMFSFLIKLISFIVELLVFGLLGSIITLMALDFNKYVLILAIFFALIAALLLIGYFVCLYLAQKEKYYASKCNDYLGKTLKELEAELEKELEDENRS